MTKPHQEIPPAVHDICVLIPERGKYTLVVEIHDLVSRPSFERLLPRSKLST